MLELCLDWAVLMPFMAKKIHPVLAPKEHKMLPSAPFQGKLHMESSFEIVNFIRHFFF